jgi:GNAT superfamily N-acetyltransferase
MRIHIRIATPSDAALVAATYASFGYRRTINPADTTWLVQQRAEGADSGEPGDYIGIVRVALEEIAPGEVSLILRGMRIHEKVQRMGVGSVLLHQVAEWLGPRECWCVPYAHLVGFYGQVDFAPVPLEDAPPVLRDRVLQYRGEGLDVILMRRGGDNQANA